MLLLLNTWFGRAWFPVGGGAICRSRRPADEMDRAPLLPPCKDRSGGPAGLNSVRPLIGPAPASPRGPALSAVSVAVAVELDGALIGRDRSNSPPATAGALNRRELAAGGPWDECEWIDLPAAEAGGRG
jgi:hypothetical protein